MGGATIIESRPRSIPFSSIDRYAQRFGIEGSAFDLLLDLIDKIDGAFLKWDGEQALARAAARR